MTDVVSFIYPLDEIPNNKPLCNTTNVKNMHLHQDSKRVRQSGY